ncbi:Hypothetical predicted protein [Lecanosticta acicola]|uniref:Uncharacterized protein n=1 Tax=Lecanosticta acicola TaxID=111012 RepID=A0AAI8YXP7_9PEZI|nr:Hypothetical predicted protein [Lecanosticta acicola]
MFASDSIIFLVRTALFHIVLKVRHVLTLGDTQTSSYTSFTYETLGFPPEQTTLGCDNETAAGVLTDIGLLLVFVQGNNHLLDVYSRQASSVITINIALRSLFAAGFSVFAKYMYQRLPPHWTLTTFGVIAVVRMRIPIAFHRFSVKLRAMSKWTPKLPSTSGSAPVGGFQSDKPNEMNDDYVDRMYNRILSLPMNLFEAEEAAAVLTDRLRKAKPSFIFSHKGQGFISAMTKAEGYSIAC